MNKAELKLKVMSMKKSSMPLSYIYDYLLVQCLLNNDSLVPESVKAVEKMTGIIIKDVRLMTCLMFYWRTLNMDQRQDKCYNILMYLSRKELGIETGPVEGIRNEEHEKKALGMLRDFLKLK